MSRQAPGPTLGAPVARPERPALSALQVLVALLLAGAGASTSVQAEPVTYVLDPDHTSVHFEVLHFGTSVIRGRFTGLTGTVLLDRAAQRGEVSLRLPVASVSTGIPVFDARLRQDDLLAPALHPEAFFVATQVRFDTAASEGSPGVAEVRGEFTLRGRSQPLSLVAQRFACRQDRSSVPAVEVCGGDFEGTVLRSEFGASFGVPFVGDRVRLLIQVEGRRL